MSGSLVRGFSTIDITADFFRPPRLDNVLFFSFFTSDCALIWDFQKWLKIVFSSVGVTLDDVTNRVFVNLRDCLYSHYAYYASSKRPEATILCKTETATFGTYAMTLEATSYYGWVETTPHYKPKLQEDSLSPKRESLWQFCMSNHIKKIKNAFNTSSLKV